MLIKSLTEDNIKLLNTYISTLIDRVVNNSKYSPDTLKVDDVYDDIKWIYEVTGHKAPQKNVIKICCSPEEERQVLKTISDTPINESIYTSLFQQSWDVMYSDIQNNRQILQPYTAIFRRLDVITNQLWEALARVMRNENNPSKKETSDQGFGFPFNIRWASVYSFLIKIGAFEDNEKIRNFERFINFIMNKGMWTIQFYNNVCVFTQMPKKIHRDTQNRLHSTESRAIEWRDGGKSKQYFIHGILFYEALWEKISNRTITVQEIFEIGNMEQRNATLAVIPPKQLIEECNAELLSTHIQKKRGKNYMNEEDYKRIQHDNIKLYRISKTKFGRDIQEDIFILFYNDPSTGREYFSFVEEKNTKDAATAMASKFNLNREEYINNIVAET